MFALQGQIYELPDLESMDTFSIELDYDMKKELVNDTAMQIAFMLALKEAMPILNSKKGIHPNIKNVSKEFDEQDQNRINAMHRTLEWFSKRVPPITPDHDISKMHTVMYNKMLKSIDEIPEAWNEDGTLKPEFADQYKKGAFDDLSFN